MARYTVICTFRRNTFARQVEANSVMDALRTWMAALETERIPNLGALSKARMAAALERNGPCEMPGLESVHTWMSPVSGYLSRVYIIQTVGAERQRRASG